MPLFSQSQQICGAFQKVQLAIRVIQPFHLQMAQKLVSAYTPFQRLLLAGACSTQTFCYLQGSSWVHHPKTEHLHSPWDCQQVPDSSVGPARCRVWEDSERAPVVVGWGGVGFGCISGISLISQPDRNGNKSEVSVALVAGMWLRGTWALLPKQRRWRRCVPLAPREGCRSWGVSNSTINTVPCSQL